MGIRDSLKEIGRYKKHEKKDKLFERDIIKNTISDGMFVTLYSSFVESLELELQDNFENLDRSKVIIRPRTSEFAKYFEQAMNDERITDLYIITKEPDGTYTFEERSVGIEI